MIDAFLDHPRFGHSLANSPSAIRRAPLTRWTHIDRNSEETTTYDDIRFEYSCPSAQGRRRPGIGGISFDSRSGSLRRDGWHGQLGQLSEPGIQFGWFATEQVHFLTIAWASLLRPQPGDASRLLQAQTRALGCGALPSTGVARFCR